MIRDKDMIGGIHSEGIRFSKSRPAYPVDAS